MAAPLDPAAWLVEVDVVDPTGVEASPQTLICQSYDGTPNGAGAWAADVLDWCEVYVRSIHRVRGRLVEAREEGRIDEPASPAPAAAETPEAIIDALLAGVEPGSVTEADYQALKAEIVAALERGVPATHVVSEWLGQAS